MANGLLFTSFDTLTNTAAVTFDSRVFTGGAGSPQAFQLLGADGRPRTLQGWDHFA